MLVIAFGVKQGPVVIIAFGVKQGPVWHSVSSRSTSATHSVAWEPDVMFGSFNEASV